MTADLEWMRSAVCAGVEGFTENPWPEQVAACSECPVKSECLSYGLEEPVTDPKEALVWGGLPPRQFAALAALSRAGRRTQSVHRWLDAIIREAVAS